MEYKHQDKLAWWVPQYAIAPHFRYVVTPECLEPPIFQTKTIFYAMLWRIVRSQHGKLNLTITKPNEKHGTDLKYVSQV